MQLSNPENKIHEEVVKVEISSEGLKALKDEEKIAFLQESLQTAGSLHRIEQGSDIRLKYGYVSAGELMKEKAPEEYEKYSFLLTKGFERNLSSPAILKAPLSACFWKNVIYSLTHSLSTLIVPFESTKSSPSIFNDEIKAFETEISLRDYLT